MVISMEMLIKNKDFVYFQKFALLPYPDYKEIYKHVMSQTM